MKLATIAFVRPPMEDAQQLSEITLRSFGIFANQGRKGDDRIAVSLLLVESLAEVKDVPDVTMIVSCGNHATNGQKDGAHHFRSIHEMQIGVAEVLKTRFPVTPAHPELKLAHGDGDDGPAYERQALATQRGGD